MHCIAVDKMALIATVDNSEDYTILEKWERKITFSRFIKDGDLSQYIELVLEIADFIYKRDLT